MDNGKSPWKRCKHSQQDLNLLCINYLRQDADTAGHPFPRLRSCNPLQPSLCLHGLHSGLPAVYLVYRRKALRAKAFRRFSFCCFGGWSTRCLPRQFFEGETRWFLPLFCVLSTFWSMQGALCCHSWLKIPFSSSLREFLPCFGRELSSAPEFKSPMVWSQVGDARKF